LLQGCADYVEDSLSVVKVVSYGLEITPLSSCDGRFEQSGPVVPDPCIGAFGQRPVDVFVEVYKFGGPGVGLDYPEPVVKGHNAGANRLDYQVGKVAGVETFRTSVVRSFLFRWGRFFRFFFVRCAHLPLFNPDCQALSSVMMQKNNGSIHFSEDE